MTSRTPFNPRRTSDLRNASHLHRKGRIEGARQEEKNAKVWLNGQGVLEVWTLWADYQDLDFEKDMPAAIRKLQDKLGTRPEPASKASKYERLSVTIILPPGARLQVIQQG